MKGRLPGALALALSLGAPFALGLAARSARARRALEQPAIAGAARLLPGPDLALSGGARHLRFLSLEEPGAAFDDMPASLDSDPGGGAVAPPREVWVEEALSREGARVERSRGP